MQPELTRKEFLAALRRAGLRVSSYQLLRWHNTGLLPQPRRVGNGRGRGTTSFYPLRALFQALWLATFLKTERRDLDEAGWYMWVFGFPVTVFARQLLTEELQAEEQRLRREFRRFKRGVRGTVFEQVGSLRRVPGLERMSRVVRGKGMTQVVRMLTEFELGLLGEQTDYQPQDWEELQAAILTEVQPAFSALGYKSELASDTDLPTALEVKARLSKRSGEVSIPQVRKALARTSDQWLCVIRDEAQAFADVLREHLKEPPALISRSTFLDYFKNLYMPHVDSEAVKEFRKRMEWSRPPRSPLVHLQQQFAARATEASAHPEEHRR